MPVTSIVADPDSLTLTAVGEYLVPVERLWRAWAEPRQLERFWGPPQWPATFTRHDMVEGGRTEYHMTGPDGTVSGGYWRFVNVEPLRGFEVLGGFANADGSANDAFPETHMRMRLEPTPTGSRFVIVSTFASVEAMEQLLAMGMPEGLGAALAQMDEVLADQREASQPDPTRLQGLDDVRVQVVREVRGSVAQVWRCHAEPALLRQWMLGPPGWTMPVCEVARKVGEHYRYVWRSDADGGEFGFTGELLELEAPARSLSTESMIGGDGTQTINELRLSARPGGRTRIELLITYPSREVRDMILGTGMAEGMEASYARLDALAPA